MAPLPILLGNPNSAAHENAPPPSSATAAAHENAPPPSSATAEPRPRLEVSKFRDDYGVMWRYCSRFDFELDPNFVYTKSKDCEDDDSEDDYDDFVDEEEDPDDVRKTLNRYVNQIRSSFGFDVDCHPPRWFDANLTPITVTQYKLNGRVGVITNFAVAEINAETGKTYKIVEVEKVVAAHLGMLFSTIRVKDEGDGEEKVIQAIAWQKVYDRCKPELLQWRYKPEEEDVWLELPPLPPQLPSHP